MAAVNYITDLDTALANAIAQQSNAEYSSIGKSLSASPTFTDKFKAVQALALKYPTVTPIVDAATQWLKDNSGDLYDSSTATYLTDGTYRNALLEANTKGKPLNTLFTKINQLRTDNVSNALKETAPDLSKTEFDTAVTNLTNGSKTTAYDPAKYTAVASKGTPAVAYKKGMTADQLKANYGSLIDPTTKKPVFTSQQLDDVANGVASASAFNKKVNSLATDAVNKSQDWSLYGGKTGSAYVSAIKNMVSDPSKLATVYKAPDVTNTPVKEGSGIDALTTPITTTGTKVGQVPSLKTWKAPQQGIATANSPYSGLLDATLAKVTGAPFGTPTNNAVYKNLTDPLTQGMGIDSLPKPKLTYDTSNPAGITGLGNITGTLQPLNTQVTSSPSYNQNQIANANAKTSLDNAATIANSTVVGGSKNDTIKGGNKIDTIKGGISADELAAQQAALSPEHIAWLNSEQARTIAFLNANANDPTKATNVTNAKSYLDSINADIARTQPDKVVAYKPTTPAVTTPAVTTPAVTTPASDKNAGSMSLTLPSGPTAVIPGAPQSNLGLQQISLPSGPTTASVTPSTFTGLNGIATNAGSVVSPEYMNTNVAGVGAPITSLLTNQQTPAMSGNIQAARDFNSYYANSTDPAIQSQVAQRNAWLSSVGG